MRSYDVASAAFALDAPKKWLDNLLSQHTVPGVERTSRGSARRIPLESLTLIAVVRDLQRELGVGVASGLALVARLPRTSRSASAHELALSPDLRLSVDLAGIQRRLERRLLDAMEAVAPRPRGRPPVTPR